MKFRIYGHFGRYKTVDHISGSECTTEINPYPFCSHQYPDLESSQRQYWQSLYVQPAPPGAASGPTLVHPMPLPHYENMRYHLVSF